MKKVEATSYAFPCSVIKANEGKFLTKADLQKLLEAKTIQQAMNILADFGYGDGKELENPRDFEKHIKKAVSDSYKLVNSILPNEIKEPVELFHYPNDYHNVKVILKAEGLNLDPTDMLVDTGSIPKDKILEMMRERNFIFMSSAMKEAVVTVMDLFAKGNDPQIIDIILDKACYQDMLNKALEIGNDFIINYVKLSIDILNVSTFIRLREIGKPWSFYQKVFLEGGNLSDKILIASWDEAYNQVAEKLAPFGFKNLIAEGTIQSLNGKYVKLEKSADNMRLSFAKDAKYVTFGVEPLVGYLVAKEIEAKNIRMILTGKIANISNEVTEERLRDTYV